MNSNYKVSEKSPRPARLINRTMTGQEWHDLMTSGKAHQGVSEAFEKNPFIQPGTMYTLRCNRKNGWYLLKARDLTVPAKPNDVRFGWEWAKMLENGTAPKEIARMLDNSQGFKCSLTKLYRLQKTPFSYILTKVSKSSENAQAQSRQGSRA